MGKPTRAQLEKINSFSAKELTEDDVYVFEPLMIDDQKTSYNSVIHTNLLKKFVKDARRGIPLLMNHNSHQLPIGRSFDSRLVDEYDEDLETSVKSVYGTFYIDLGRNTESNMTTDDIVKGIDSGTIFDVSIGFNAKKWECSICGHDIRDYLRCSHIPGRVYEVEGEDNIIRNEECYVIVGKDGNGELLELSLVYAGACNRATIKNFSNESTIDFENSSKLSIVDEIKNIPMDANIYQYYTKDGSILLTDTDERTNGIEYLNKRSEDNVELNKILEVLSTSFGVTIENETQLSEKLTEMSGALSSVKEELSIAKTELEATKTELETTKAELAMKDETIIELEKSNVELAAKAEMADTYRKDLIKETIEFGIRANGNAFQAELFEKFLSTLSIDEIKTTRDGFKNAVNEKFEGYRQTDGENDLQNKLDNEVPDKEDEIAFRAFVAEKAVEYAKENKISISEATKLMYKKYSSEEGEDK